MSALTAAEAGMPYEQWRRYRTCDRKNVFAAEHLAANYAMLRGWADPSAPVLHPYLCPFCGSWHVTSQAEGARDDLQQQ